MLTQILLDHEPVADGGYLVRALLQLTGEAPDPDDRVPLNLSVVLDRSGSMEGKRQAGPRKGRGRPAGTPAGRR
jgi:secreted protein with Ig-like and vWFA domain